MLKCYKIESKKDKDWTHSFHLITYDKSFILYAQTKRERDMWVTGFDYVIYSTL